MEVTQQYIISSHNFTDLHRFSQIFADLHRSSQIFTDFIFSFSLSCPM